MSNDIKNELHKLVDNCNNEMLLSEAKALLELNKQVKDWWDELTEKSCYGI